jgi:hypothetical protein
MAQGHKGSARKWLRFNDPARYPAVNSGTLGYVAEGELSLTTNIAAGRSPQPMRVSRQQTRRSLDGLKQWAFQQSWLEHLSQITLEA